MIPSSDRGHLATFILAVRGGRSPAQAGSRCLEDLKEGVRGTVVRSEARRMNRPHVAYFLSGVLAYFPSGARIARHIKASSVVAIAAGSGGRCSH